LADGIGPWVKEHLDEGGEIDVHRSPSQIVGDGRTGLVERMAEALSCRYSGKPPSDAAREFMGARIVDLAKVICHEHGLNVRHAWDNAEIIRLAHTTSDFPNLLQGTGERMLLAAYAASQPALKQVARRSTVSDFRTKSVLRLGEAPALLEVNEHGEVTQGTRAEAAESYRARTFGRIFSITRQALINDDLSAFADFTRAYGVAAATLEGKLLSDLLISNPAMSDNRERGEAVSRPAADRGPEPRPGRCPRAGGHDDLRAQDAGRVRPLQHRERDRPEGRGPTPGRLFGSKVCRN